MNEQRPSRRQELEEWWAFLARVLAFLLGGVLLMIEAFSNGQRFYLILAAIALIGPAAAQSVAAMFASLRGER